MFIAELASDPTWVKPFNHSVPYVIVALKKNSDTFEAALLRHDFLGYRIIFYGLNGRAYSNSENTRDGTHGHYRVYFLTPKQVVECLKRLSNDESLAVVNLPPEEVMNISKKMSETIPIVITGGGGPLKKNNLSTIVDGLAARGSIRYGRAELSKH